MPLPFDPIDEAHRNWRSNDWGAADPMAAATSITRAHQVLLHRIDAALAPFDLNFSRFEALALLHFSRHGSMPLGKVGDRLQVHPTSVTNTIDRLEADGLVRRTPHPTDRRTTLAEITRRGRTTVEQAAGALADIRFGLDGMGRDDLSAVTAALTSLRQGAGDF
ncbi:MAG: MarR family transcriptional regulator [Acidimicrobiales bacterium]|jgi:DNA-binding MarR family transcriptional regulator|uniref:HTH marR-type domain-containing protein n=1 Tax=marine metagenome TaxID=408172 RepID=A0A381ZZQ5_9ZZZZ|nr:MarR family transcriptional regulator [Actinomycetes bacterium]MDP6105911.1 MarR family transcriptional regulator [Acidimicrobiales bacterium]MCP4844541.1 MarR family transcriptional regulator [Actinomycetes bacterium]MDP6240493.1 MarR family transcriptional regulator [Acidimicrobiales bacterium]MDP7123987.1 MarR family transcriptional regulator [Acidimicrobiales bacterium]|tara:strand:- start:3901 stop:4392 length:492 start_codon:yes stop_codon:yes gene_type:complete